MRIKGIVKKGLAVAAVGFLGTVVVASPASAGTVTGPGGKGTFSAVEASNPNCGNGTSYTDTAKLTVTNGLANTAYTFQIGSASKTVTSSSTGAISTQLTGPYVGGGTETVSATAGGATVTTTYTVTVCAGGKG